MAASLVALAGPLRGEVLPLTDDGLTIGREPSNQLHPNDLALSRRHCRIAVGPDRVTVIDLDSLNGTFVNGAAVKERPLEHGDHLKLGESIFVFLDRDAPVPGQSAVVFTDDAPATTVTLRREDLIPRLARELQALLRVSAALATIRDSETLRATLLNLLLETIPGDRAAVLGDGDEEGEFSSVVARSRDGTEPVPISRTVVRQVIADGVALLCNEPATSDTLRRSESLIGTATHSVLCAPVVVSDACCDALYVASRDPSVRFDDEHLQLIISFAALAGLALQNVHRIEQLEHEASILRADLARGHNMIGDSAAMQKAWHVLAKAAPTDSTVLILGESGTGKELAARAVHQNSPRAGGPFVAVTAAVLSESLLESELFGHEKGAFTGAISQKKGQLELASGGTVFLDEIGDLAPGMQVKLLRVLQEREVTRVGGTRPIRIDVRFIAATHRDLDAAVKEGRFREDLYYRLKVVQVRMPPLRDRREDIPLLARFFLRRFSARCKRRVTSVSDAAMSCLVRYDWPGNIRELENAIERAVVLGATDLVEIDDLPENILDQRHDSTPRPGDFHDAVRVAKQQIVTTAFATVGGKHADAARYLGLHPNNLRRLMKSLGLKETKTSAC